MLSYLHIFAYLWVYNYRLLWHRISTAWPLVIFLLWTPLALVILFPWHFQLLVHNAGILEGGASSNPILQKTTLPATVPCHFPNLTPAQLSLPLANVLRLGLGLWLCKHNLFIGSPPKKIFFLIKFKKEARLIGFSCGMWMKGKKNELSAGRLRGSRRHLEGTCSSQWSWITEHQSEWSSSTFCCSRV